MPKKSAVKKAAEGPIDLAWREFDRRLSSRPGVAQIPGFFKATLWVMMKQAFRGGALAAYGTAIIHGTIVANDVSGAIVLEALHAELMGEEDGR
jgi:hypothetical protein